MVLSLMNINKNTMKVKYPNVLYRLGDVKDKPSLVRSLYEFKPTVVINTLLKQYGFVKKTHLNQYKQIL